ncbi:MAG: HAD-IA family hydrolase [Akkermansiaceae bacterium]
MTFLFDIGNVLLNLHFDRFHNAILSAGQTALPADMFKFKDPYESGKMSDQDFITRSLDLLEKTLTEEQFILAWQNIFSPNKPMWDVVTKLHTDDHRLILFSNTNALHAESFLRDFEIFSLFHHHHFSHETGANKPDPLFYENAIRDYDLTPSETIYLDDLAENIATGIALGFQCFQYDLTDHEAAEKWLTHQLTNNPSLP